VSATKSTSEAEGEDGAVANAEHGAGVTFIEHGPDAVGGGGGLAPWRGAERAANAGQDLAEVVAGAWVGLAPELVSVGDGGQPPPDAAYAGAAVGEGGDVQDHGVGGGRHGGEAARRAPPREGGEIAPVAGDGGGGLAGLCIAAGGGFLRLDGHESAGGIDGNEGVKHGRSFVFENTGL
jgi:hypothetical protein